MCMLQQIWLPKKTWSKTLTKKVARLFDYYKYRYRYRYIFYDYKFHGSFNLIVYLLMAK